MGFNVQFCRVVLFVFPFLCLFVFFSQIQCNNNKKSKSVVSKYNRDCAFISWFSVSNLVVLYYSFSFSLCVAGERQRTVSSAKAADVSGLRVCFSFLCRRKVAQVSSLSVCIIIFLCRRK